jgi:hypothetical protein
MGRKEAMAKAKEYTSSLPAEHWTDLIKRDEFEDRYARNLQFDADFNEWLRLRSKLDDDETDEQYTAREACEDELVHRILTAPMDCGESVFRKIEVVEYCITLHGEGSWGDLLALTALSAIKADILRHGLLREAHLYEK